MLRLLVKHGAKLDTPNFSGCTPLCAACIAGHADIVQELLNYGTEKIPIKFLLKRC